MTQSQQPPTDPDLVAEVAPGEGPEPGSVEYGGSDIHQDGAGAGAEGAEGAEGAVGGGPVTTEAGTFEDLPVAPEEQTE